MIKTFVIECILATSAACELLHESWSSTLSPRAAVACTKVVVEVANILRDHAHILAGDDVKVGRVIACADGEMSRTHQHHGNMMFVHDYRCLHVRQHRALEDRGTRGLGSTARPEDCISARSIELVDSHVWKSC